MARGMANNEPVVSQASTEEFREGYVRALGDHKPQRGKWVMTDHGLVPVDEYQPESRAIDGPIMVDRFMEGASFDDGERVVDLGSRRKRREFFRESGLTDRSDYAPGWQERKQAEKNRHLDRRTHEAFEQAARKFYNQGKLPK